MRGRINPKVMAMMIRNAVAPLVAMLVSRAAGALGPIETNSTRPAAALNSKKPGIIETTAEKARAAKGRCRRSTTADQHAGHERPSHGTSSRDGDQCPACGMGEHAGGYREQSAVKNRDLYAFRKKTLSFFSAARFSGIRAPQKPFPD
jgi:hypothetical protein